MSELEVDMYFSFRSPWSYYGAWEMARVREIYAMKVNLLVVSPLYIRYHDFFEKAHEKWRPYFLTDLLRYSEYRGLPIANPRPDPITEGLPADDPGHLVWTLSPLGIAAAAAGRGLEFAREVSGIVWNGQVDESLSSDRTRSSCCCGACNRRGCSSDRSSNDSCVGSRPGSYWARGRIPMKLYYDPSTVNCRKVLAGAELVGAKYETVLVDFAEGEHKKPAYTAVNPNQKLPALVDGDLTLWESNAILQYLADVNDAADAYPTDLQTRADINRWLFWESNSWFPSCYIYMIENVDKPFMGEEPDAAILEAEDPNFHTLAGILEARLQGQDWLCGDRVSIADISMASPMFLYELQKLPLERHATLRAWMDRVEALPSWQKTDPKPALGLA